MIVSITLFLFWWRKIFPKKVCEKMENNSTLEKILLVCNRNVELLRLLGATFDSKVAFFRRMRKKNMIILKKVCRKKFAIFCFICLPLLSFELSKISWKCSENFNMLTGRNYDSAVFKVLLNIITICVFIAQ